MGCPDGATVFFELSVFSFWFGTGFFCGLLFLGNRFLALSREGGWGGSSIYWRGFSWAHGTAASKTEALLDAGGQQLRKNVTTGENILGDGLRRDLLQRGKRIPGHASSVVQSLKPGLPSELNEVQDMASSLLRVFVAVDVPEGDVKEKIAEFQGTLTQTGADLKPVEPENIHITLRFLGDTAGALVEELKGELRKVEFQPFKVIFKGTGVFPDHSRINVVWIGIDEGNIGLVDLCGKINRSLARYNIPPDRRGFSPHLTVARVRSGRNIEALSKMVKTLSDLEFGAFEVDSFALKQSTLTPKGPIYKDLLQVMATQPS
jgi:2'-5' RNA ligase